VSFRTGEGVEEVAAGLAANNIEYWFRKLNYYSNRAARA
jgi:hypothetical protein